MPRIKPLIAPVKKDPVRRMAMSAMDDRNMTQADLSRVLGVNSSTVSRWMRNPDRMTIGSLRALCKALDLPITIHIGDY